MNLKVYGEPENEDPPVRLRLRSVGDGAVGLCAVNEHGDFIDGGNILIINSSGYLLRCSGVDPSFGFPTNESGEIEEMR